jgi:hypothetical protein
MRQLAQNALTTLSAARLMTGAPDDETSTEKLTLLINQASAAVESAIERQLRLQPRTEHITPTGGQHLMLRHWPVVGVERVTQDGLEIDPSCYTVEDGGMLYCDGGWPWSGYSTGLAYDPVAVRRNVDVKYSAGYVLPKDETPEQPTTLPADLESLVLDMVQAAWGKLNSGGNAGLKSFAISDVRWDWTTETPQPWLDIIARYKRWA